jgi:phytanoyl-CoA hydroxylase
LSVQQISDYEKNGYIVIENFWDTSTVSNLKNRIGEIVAGLNLNDEVHSLGFTKSIFTTKEDRRDADDYFLSSGYAIRFFWEENAWVDDKLSRPPEVSINKIGHGLHDIDPQFSAVTYESRIGQICRDLGMLKPLAVQSMYIFKQALVGGEVCAHQGKTGNLLELFITQRSHFFYDHSCLLCYADGAFLYTEPQSVIGFWWALDDCRLDNGCLWAVPGSHNIGVERRYRRKDPPQKGTEFVPPKAVDFDLNGAIPLLIPKGSLVILHSALVHYSAENKSNTARHAYSVHIVDGKVGVVYPVDNWLQRPPEHPFQVVP